ncbi:MAG TPA: amidohydrolase [Thermomicrobiales bacterium]|nr:amidohydrolase [Thermomicrobiales bacterium]
MSEALIVHGGPILTMSDEEPVVDAIGIHHGVVVATGSASDVRSMLPAGAESIHLDGRLATPGLFDAHAHTFMTGFSLLEVDVTATSVASITEIRQRIAERATKSDHGEWIIGQGYDQASLEEQRHPNRIDLDEAAPEHPVALWRSCHHIMAVNSRALELAGIDRNTPDPDGGTIDRDEHGEPTGVLRESATDLVQAVQPEPSQRQIADAIVAGGREFIQHGVTAVAEAGIRTNTQLRAYQGLWRGGTLPIRSYLMMIIDETLDTMIDLGISTGFGDEWLRIGPAKLFSDGSIGGRTARMRRPYEGEESNVGLWMMEPEDLKAKVRRAHDAGFQLGIHAIGDAAIDLVLDAYEEAQTANPRDDTRHRIEHCSIVDLDAIARIKRLGVVPIPGTSFLHYTRPAYEQNLGRDRYRYAYAMKTYAAQGIIAAASSDAPVVPVDPLIGIQTMVTRKDRLGVDAWTEERISVEDAIRAYTVNAAYSAFAEKRRGRLLPGMLGDVTIFDQDLRAMEPDTIMTAKVDLTIADGQVVWDRTNADA